MDEMYDAAISQALRRAGHDVVSIQRDLPELRSADDRTVWEFARAGRRAVFTNNVIHFHPIAAEDLAAGRDHWGVLSSTDQSIYRTKANNRVFIRRLRAFLEARPGDDDFKNGYDFL